MNNELDRKMSGAVDALAKKSRWGKPRLLIVGCGDIGMRLLPLLRSRFRVFAITTQRARFTALRAAGAVPVLADLDQPASLKRLAGLAHHVIHLAPPAQTAPIDYRTRNLIAILPEHANLVYVSTSGVYGDCGGARFDETRPVNPGSPRAVRRVDAEQRLRCWAIRSGGHLAILRVPGIYASERLPLERLRKGTPALLPAEDVYTNHIHADDLARIIVQALFHAKANRVYHAVDDDELQMGEYFDLVADAAGLPRPLRLSRTVLTPMVSPMLLSFMSESRRLDNQRLRQELRVRLRYPNVFSALQQMVHEGRLKPSTYS